MKGIWDSNRNPKPPLPKVSPNFTFFADGPIWVAKTRGIKAGPWHLNGPPLLEFWVSQQIGYFDVSFWIDSASEASYINGCFRKIGVFPPKWMVKIMENPIKMDDLGVPLRISGNIQIHKILYMISTWLHHDCIHSFQTVSHFCKCQLSLPKQGAVYPPSSM